MPGVPDTGSLLPKNIWLCNLLSFLFHHYPPFRLSWAPKNQFGCKLNRRTRGYPLAQVLSPVLPCLSCGSGTGPPFSSWYKPLSIYFVVLLVHIVILVFHSWNGLSASTFPLVLRLWSPCCWGIMTNPASPDVKWTPVLGSVVWRAQGWAFSCVGWECYPGWFVE